MSEVCNIDEYLDAGISTTTDVNEEKELQVINNYCHYERSLNNKYFEFSYRKRATNKYSRKLKHL